MSKCSKCSIQLHLIFSSSSLNFKKCIKNIILLCFNQTSNNDLNKTVTVQFLELNCSNIQWSVSSKNKSIHVYVN